MMCTNMTTILSHQEDLGPSMLDVKYEGLGGTGLVTTPLNMAPNLSECNVSHSGIHIHGWLVAELCRVANVWPLVRPTVVSRPFSSRFYRVVTLLAALTLVSSRCAKKGQLVFIAAISWW